MAIFKRKAKMIELQNEIELLKSQVNQLQIDLYVTNQVTIDLDLEYEELRIALVRQQEKSISLEENFNLFLDEFVDNGNSLETFIFLSCVYLDDKNQKTYHYLAEDGSIKKSDIVMAPVRNNLYKKAVVIDVRNYTRLNAPYPVNKTKTILYKLDETAEIEENCTHVGAKEIISKNHDQPLLGADKCLLTGGEKSLKLFGVPIFEQTWHYLDKHVSVIDPLYHQMHNFTVHFIEVDNQKHYFAAGEFSNGIFGFYSVENILFDEDSHLN